MNGERQRLFFALWPDDATRAALAAACSPLLRDIHGRHMPVANWHVTLAFLGAVDADARQCMEDNAARIRFKSCELVLDHLHYVKRSRILWLGASVTPPAISALAAQLAETQARCGLASESRAFRPHMTLMRDAKSREAPPLVAPFSWGVNEFVLVESRTLPTGAEYSVLRRFA